MDKFKVGLSAEIIDTCTGAEIAITNGNRTHDFRICDLKSVTALIPVFLGVVTEAQVGKKERSYAYSLIGNVNVKKVGRKSILDSSNYRFSYGFGEQSTDQIFARKMLETFLNSTVFGINTFTCFTLLHLSNTVCTRASIRLEKLKPSTQPVIKGN